MKTAQQIPLRAVLAEIVQPGAVFDLTYRKTDGSFGRKESCRLPVARGQLTERRKLNRSGMLNLLQKGRSQPFTLYIDLLVSFNGQTIDHE